MRTFSSLSLLLILLSCQSQTESNRETQMIGGRCEGCKAIYEYGTKVLTPVDTLPGFLENEPRLKVFGTVYEQNGKTAAQGVIIYIYHTNRKGIYETKGNEKGWDRRHGFIRGWTKTNASGEYTFYTFRPTAYPNTSIPEHIHVTIKEPDKNEYYLDDFVFDDDPLLTSSSRRNKRNRGGSGIVRLEKRDRIYHIKRDLILGLNIPDYY